MGWPSAATPDFALTWNRPGGVHWREGDGVAELLERSHEAGGQALLVGALEVIGPEIAIGDTPGEHDVDGGEHGRGHRHDRLLGPAPRPQAIEQGAVIAGLPAPPTRPLAPGAS